MSFETGTASSVGDLIAKWFNFLQANGWTADVDYAAAGQSPAYGIIQRKVDLASPLGSDPLNEVNLHCGFAVADSNADGDHMNMIPMRNYTSGAPQLATEVGTSTGAYTSVSGASHINTNFPSSPFDNYWFFESDYYAHAVVEFTTGFYRHFGMGSINKIGKWFGGEYYYGSFWSQNAALIEAATATSHSVGLDGSQTASGSAALLYGKQLSGEAFPDLVGRQSPASAWHVFSQTGDAGAGIGTDADGRDKGGVTSTGPRGGVHYPLFWQGQSAFNGFRPLHPITIFTLYTGSNPDNVIPIGTQPDVRAISMEGALEGGDEFTIGTDTWVAFPVARKRQVKVFDDTEYSGFFGLAYKKVTV